MSWDGTYHTTFIIRTKLSKLNISPIRLLSASSVHIPSSVNNFRNMLPAIRLYPLRSHIIRKYTKPFNAFKRCSIYPNVSKCNAKRCVCCTHLCTKSTITPSVMVDIYNINVLQRTACLVVNPIMIGNFAFPFNCRHLGRTSDSMTVLT